MPADLGGAFNRVFSLWRKHVGYQRTDADFMREFLDPDIPRRWIDCRQDSTYVTIKNAQRSLVKKLSCGDDVRPLLKFKGVKPRLRKQ